MKKCFLTSLIRSTTAATCAVLTLAACGASDDATVEVLNTQNELPGLPADAVSTEATQPESWDEIAERFESDEVKALLPPEDSILFAAQNDDVRSFAGSSNFVPAEGNTSIINSFEFLDTCNPDEIPPNAEEGILSIADVDSEAKTFTYLLTFPTFPDSAIPCEYHGRFYSCTVDDQVLNFAPFGLDATVTLGTKRNGLFVNSSIFLDTLITSAECEGADCALPPASNLFGILLQVPCNTATITGRSID